MNDGKHIKDIKLFNFGCNKRYINPYIKQPHEYINEWNIHADREHQRDCVRFLLRTQFHKLADRNLISDQVLGDPHLDGYFKGEFTVRKIIEFVKTQLNDFGTIYIYDPTGQVLIDYYIGNKHEVSAILDNNINNKNISRRYCHTAIGILNCNHIDPITEPNVSKSISHGGVLSNIFSMPVKNEQYTFELFNNPEKIACGDDTYNEYDENNMEKNKDADIILFQDDDIDTTYSEDDGRIIEHDDGTTTVEIPMQICKDVKDLIHRISNFHNVIITNPIFEGKELVGFIHPITKQQFIKTSDFYKRKKVCDMMFAETQFEELFFKNQSWFQISKLFLGYYDLGSFDGLSSHHSEEQRNLSLENPISQYIGRHDDDNKLEDRHKPSETNITYTFDIIKSYSSVSLHRNAYWVVPSAHDEFEKFDMNNSKHINIP